MGDIALMMAAPPATDDYWYQPRGKANAAGMEVTPDSAMTVSAVYACVTYIAESIATLPLPIFQRIQVNGQDGKKPAPNMPLWDLLNYQPNEYQTAIAFREMVIAMALLRPRSVNEIIPGPRGPVDQIVPLHPDLVTKQVTRAGVLRYLYRDPLRDFTERVLMPDEVFVVDGRFGRSVLEFARETIGLDLAMQRYQGQLYSRGARPSGALKTDKVLTDPQKRNLRKALDEYAVTGQHSGRPLLLQDGMTWESIGFSAADAELIASKQMSNADAARYFRVPLHKIQELQRATNNNIAEQGDDAIEGLIPWCERVEQAIQRDLIIAKKVFFAEHLLEGLMRGNVKDRFEAYQIAVMWGIYNRNEVRAKENANPYPGGEIYLTPLNEGPVGPDGRPMLPPGGSGNTTGNPAAQATDAGIVRNLRLFMRDAAARVVRKEQATLEKLAERTGGSGEAWMGGVRSFYAEHGEFVGRIMRLSDEDAQAYVDLREQRLLMAGPQVLAEDELDRIDVLYDTSLARSADLNPNALEPRPAAPAVPATASEHVVHIDVPPPVIRAPDVHVTVAPTPVEVAAPDMAPIAAAISGLEAVLNRPRKVARDPQGRIVGLEG